MGADKSTLNLSTQVQSLVFRWKKASLGVSSPLMGSIKDRWELSIYLIGIPKHIFQLFKTHPYYIITFVTIMCRNDELSSTTMSWVHYTLSATRYKNVKRMGITEILWRIWLSSVNEIKSSESVSKQPSQLIIAAHNCHIESFP